MATSVPGRTIKPHLATSGTTKILLNLPDVYGNLSTATGITEVTGDPPEDANFMEVGTAIKFGYVRKIKVSYRTGTGDAAKTKYATLLVTNDKAAKARSLLVQQQYLSNPIRTAYYPLRYRYG